MNPDPQNLCEPFEPAISAMIDGELDSAEKLELGQHLIRCERCRNLVRQFESINRVVYALGEMPAAQGETPQVQLTRPAKPPRGRRRLLRLIPIGLASAVAIGLLIVAWPAPSVNATPITAEQLIGPMQDMHQIHQQQQRDQQLMLQLLEMDLRSLRLAVAEMDQDDAGRAEIEARINAMIQRVLNQQFNHALAGPAEENESARE